MVIPGRRDAPNPESRASLDSGFALTRAPE
jgi:hypothetical protein